MFSKIQLILLLSFFNLSYSQDFIPSDEATLELVENVNYNLFLNKVNVYSGITKNDRPTTLPSTVSYDSITFSKVEYKVLGVKKEAISNTVLLSKNIIRLDEVVVTSSKDKYIILGEKNRFVKKRSNSIRKEMENGIVVENKYKTNLELKKLVFFVDKIKFKTAYKIHFYEFKQIPLSIGHQNAEIGNLLFSTETLYIQPKQKGAIEVKLKDDAIILNENPIFISIELVANYDENNNAIETSFEDSTKIKFQLSNQANYYAKVSDSKTHKLTDYLVNINAMMRYDFAFGFRKKPHKSIFVAPAILLYARNAD